MDAEGLSNRLNSMGSNSTMSPHDRHAFRPNLLDAELEDRILLIGPPSMYLMQVPSTGWGNYFNVPGFSYYFGGSGGSGGGSNGSGFTSSTNSGPLSSA